MIEIVVYLTITVLILYLTWNRNVEQSNKATYNTRIFFKLANVVGISPLNRLLRM